MPQLKWEWDAIPTLNQVVASFVSPFRSKNVRSIGIEGAMVNHALEAVFLSLAALPVHLGPRGRLHGRLDPRRAPVYQGLALSRLNNYKMPGIICPGYLPWPTIDLCAILSSLLQRGFKALQAVMLIIVEHAEEATVLVGKCTSQGHRIDCAVDDKHRDPSGQGHLLTIVDNELRQVLVRRMILHQEALARCIMGDDGL